MRMPETIDLGDGFVLERVTQAHAAELARAVGESLEHLRPWMPWANPSQALAENQRERLAGVEDLWDRGREFQFVVRRVEEPAVLGAIGLISTDRWGLGAETIEIGYWIHVDWSGQGLATRSSRALTDTSFGLGGIQRVAIVCDEANGASVAVPRKLGFTLDRVVERTPEARGETGRMQVWLRGRDAVSENEEGGPCDSNN